MICAQIHLYLIRKKRFCTEIGNNRSDIFSMLDHNSNEEKKKMCNRPHIFG